MINSMFFLSTIYSSFKKSLKGEERLWIVFWGWFVLILSICLVTRFFLGSAISEWLLKPLPHPLPLLYLDIVFILTGIITITFRAILVVMVWRCAPNAHAKLWRHAARLTMFLFALLSIYGLTSSICNAISQHNAIATIRKDNQR